MQRGDKLVRRVGNFVVSGGHVPLRNLKNQSILEKIDGNLIAEITGAGFEDLEAEAARRRIEGETSDPNFTADFKNFAQERVKDALSAIPRGRPACA